MQRYLVPAMLITVLSGSIINLSVAAGLESAPIKRITLYPNSALIERNITVTAGQREVILEGMPANFDIAALQVSSNGIQIGNITNQDSASTKPMGQTAIALQQKIQQLEDQISMLNVELQAAELQTRYLDRLTSPVPQTQSVKSQAQDAFATIRRTQIAKRDLEQQLTDLKRDFVTLGSTRFNTRQLSIQVYAPQGGQLTLKYLVNQARWQPFYKATLNTTTRQLRLERMALVNQRTGEDWRNVDLTISTGQPSAYINSLNPGAWNIYYQPPMPKNELREMAYAAPPPPPVVAPMMVAKADAVLDEPEQAPLEQYQQVDTAYTTTFKTNGLISIPTSQQQVTIPLSSQQFNTNVSVRVVPQQAQLAILNAEIDQPDGVWSTGTVKLYRDDDYIGQSSWQGAANRKLNFSFGQDDNVKVTVRPIANTTDKASGFGQKQRKVLEQQYTVQNLHQQPINLVLLDSVPQSQSNQVVITSQFNPQPTQKSWQDQPNIYQWQQVIPAQGEFNLRIKHEFTYPGVGEVSGLP